MTMTRPRIVGCLGVALGMTVALAWAAVAAWNVQRIGTIEVRRHALTGIVQILRDGVWQRPFEIDPQAPAVPIAQLRRVRIEDATWGEDGLLTARALVPPGEDVRGRLVITLLIADSNGRRVRDRSLRVTVQWPAGTTTPFVLDTNLERPGPQQKTTLSLENVQ
jgi:hypothetical protein